MESWATGASGSTPQTCRLSRITFGLQASPALATIPAVLHLGESCDKWVGGLHGPDRCSEAKMCAMAIKVAKAEG